MSKPEMELAARLHEVCVVLARRMPVVLAAMLALLETVLATADRDLRIERMATAQIALSAEQVLEVARVRGVPALGEAAGDRLILLASLGLDLADSSIRAALIELHRRGELRLARISEVAAVRAGLAARGLPADLVEESAIDDGNTTFHAVAIA